MVVSRDSFSSILISPDTKQNFYFISRTISKSDVLLKAYPLICKSLERWLVIWRPAISNLSNRALMMLPSNTGRQWVTPSPASKRRAVNRPSAYNDINAWYPYCILSQPNFSNMISIIPTLLEIGFIIASVRKTDLPFRLVTPILLKEYPSNISMSSQFLTIPSSVGWLSSNNDRYLDASSPTMIYFSWTSSPKLSSDLNIGLPTSDAKDALGKLSPAKPIFMYPVPGSHIIVSERILIFVDIYYFPKYLLKISIVNQDQIFLHEISYIKFPYHFNIFIIILLMSSLSQDSNVEPQDFKAVGNSERNKK